jgi:organic hydroperoxide reductase OsmC/OhrA
VNLSIHQTASDEPHDAQFKRLAAETERKCPVSNLLRNGLAITLDASLAG